MGAIYTNILTYVLMGWTAGVCFLQIPRRPKGAENKYRKKSARLRWLVPLADRLLDRTAMVPVVVLPLMTAAFLVLAFVSGQLSELEFPWPSLVQSDGSLFSSLRWVFTLIYAGVAALIVAGAGFLLQSRPESGSEDAQAEDGSLIDHPKGKIEWPWPRRDHGSGRRWAARGCGIGAWLLVGTVVVLVPTMLYLVFEVTSTLCAGEAMQAACH